MRFATAFNFLAFVSVSLLSRLAFAQSERVRESVTQVRVPMRAIWPDTIEAIEFSPSFRLLAIGVACGEVRLWDIESDKEVATLWPCNRAKFLIGKSSQNSVVSLKFSQDERTLFARSRSAVGAWATGTGEQLFSHAEKLSWTTHIQLSDAGKFLVSIAAHSPPLPGETKTVVTYYDTVDGRIAREIHLPWGGSKSISSLEISPTSDLFASGSYGQIRFWNSLTGEEQDPIPAGDFVVRVAFSPDGQRLASQTSTGEYDLWDLRTKNKISHLGKFGAGSKYMAFLDATKLLISAGGKWVLLDTLTWKQLSGQGMPVAYSRDANFLLTSFGKFEIWDLRSGDKKIFPEVSRFESSGFGSSYVVLSHDGKRVWNVRGNQSSWSLPVELWSTDTGEKIKQIVIPGWCAMNRAASRDVQWCANGGEASGIPI